MKDRLAKGYVGTKFKTTFLERRTLDEYKKEFSILKRAVKKLLELGEVFPQNCGNVSMRTKEGILIKRAGCNLTTFSLDDIVLIKEYDLKKKRISVIGQGNPSSESMVHLSAYEARPRINFVLHNHDPIIVNNEKTLLRLGYEMTPKEVPYGTAKLAKMCRDILDKKDFVLMKNHGPIALGKTFNDALKIMIQVHRSVKEHKISWILLDLDDTLYNSVKLERDSEKACWRYFSKYYEITFKDFLEVYHISRMDVHRKYRNKVKKHCRNLYFQKLLKNLKIKNNGFSRELEKVYWDNLISKMRPFPGVMKTLKELKSRGIKLGVISNLKAEIQDRKLKKLGIQDLVEFNMTSDKAGIEKPSIKIFRKATNLTNTSRNKILYVGNDIIIDVEGAQKARLKALWFNKVKLTNTTLIEPYGEIRRFSEILDYVD